MPMIASTGTPLCLLADCRGRRRARFCFRHWSSQVLTALAAQALLPGFIVPHAGHFTSGTSLSWWSAKHLTALALFSFGQFSATLRTGYRIAGIARTAKHSEYLPP